MQLQGKVAIVTGGAQGIGRAIVERFASEGATVVMADVQEQGQETAQQIQTTSGSTVMFQRTDVLQEAEIKSLIELCTSQFGQMNIIVNNAWQWLKGRQTVETIDVEEWERGFRLAISATLWSTKYAVPQLVRQGGGSIISISSVHGILPAAGWLPYEPMKGGLLHLVRSLAVELGPKNIRVNAISPGLIITEANQDRISLERREFWSQCYPLRRPGQAADVAAAALFLASDQSAFITGHNLVVDGGLTIRLSEDVLAQLPAGWQKK